MWWARRMPACCTLLSFRIGRPQNTPNSWGESARMRKGLWRIRFERNSHWRTSIFFTTLCEILLWLKEERGGCRPGASRLFMTKAATCVAQYRRSAKPQHDGMKSKSNWCWGEYAKILRRACHHRWRRPCRQCVKHYSFRHLCQYSTSSLCVHCSR